MNHSIRIKLVLVFIWSALVLSACESTGKLTRRYHSVEYKTYPKDSIKYYLGVNAYVFEPDAPKPPAKKTVYDLSAQGQKELMKVLGSKEAKSDDFLKKLSKPLVAEKKDPVTMVDNTKFTKRLVFSVRNLSAYQADRIWKVGIQLNMADPNIQILSFDKLITQYGSVDVGKLDFSSTTNLGISANAGAGAGAATDTSSSTASIPAQAGFGYGINANASNSKTFAEEVLLKQRYVSLSGYITPKSINLYEEGVSGIDLSGNIIAEVTLQYKKNDGNKLVYKFNDLIKDNNDAKPDSVDIAEQYILYPNLADDIKMTLSYSGTMRHVNGGDRTISESDDDIELRQGDATVAEPVSIVPKDQLAVKLWEIANGNTVLQISSPLANPYGNLFFDSFEEAKQFLFWLKKTKTAILAGHGFLSSKVYQLLVAGGPIDSVFIDNCFIKVVQ